MKWRNRRSSSNIEDRRSSGAVRSGKKLGGLSVLGITLVSMYFGLDPKIILGLIDNSTSRTSTTQQSTYQPSAEQQQLAEFVSVVLADTEDTWHRLFQQQGMRYEEPKLVLFSDSVASACGHAQASMGPFYCPGDHKVYIDLGFYQQLKTQHNAPGDFAQAYVIAHEVGHHIQTILGISQEVRKAQRGLDSIQANQLSVKLELQADCYAGLWAHDTEKAKQILEQGDIAEALNAASAIGDDRLQKQARGYASPESFTHGSSEQRVRWFKQGFTDGTIAGCNTFAAAPLRK